MLRVSANGRYFQHEDGRPFFYLADTAWCLFARLTREETDRYLENRNHKQFTVIQAVLLIGPVTAPNAYGDAPLPENDITRPNEAYFRHADYVIHQANSLGMYVGLLPCWGDKVGRIGPVTTDNLISEANARSYGRFLGERYASANIIWILGGDHTAYGKEHIWREMAAGIEEGDKGRGLMTYHPDSQWNSCAWFHNDRWLDFNMLQSGHSLFRDNWRDVSISYALHPPKPVIDGEPGYEEIPHDFNPLLGYLNDYQARLFAYCAVFAGAAGHTYGCNPVFQFYDPSRQPTLSPRMTWQRAIDLPGALQMKWLRALMESRPYFPRVPAISLVRCKHTSRFGYVVATRDLAEPSGRATYIMVYFATHKEAIVDTSSIASKRLRYWWFNPRSGEAGDFVERENTGELHLAPPTVMFEDDWVLVIDDADVGYPPPGGAPLQCSGDDALATREYGPRDMAVTPMFCGSAWASYGQFREG